MHRIRIGQFDLGSLPIQGQTKPENLGRCSGCVIDPSVD